VHVNYGTALHLKGDVKQAVKHYCEALRLEPDNRRAESNINIALDALMESDEIDMDIATAGPNGEMELVPRHPCPPKARPTP
jgi:Flp pilus assembly protein TadD